MMESGQGDKADYSDPNAKPKSQVPVRRARERELERKRARGEISCAECRRLKLKCNKKVPCSSCIRRGCHTICPNGLLTAGQGSRFVLANTDKLHSKLVQMSQRIRQLEDALQITQSAISKTPHPLLSEELLAVKSGVDGLASEVKEKEAAEEFDKEEEEDELAVALGTLAVSENGATRFVGRVAADTFLVNLSIEEATEHSHASACADLDMERNLPEALVFAAKDFPLQYHHLPKEELMALILEHIPSYERATALAEAYLENLSWLPRPIQRDQIMENLIPLLYKGKYVEQTNPQTDENGKYTGMAKMHNLALILAVFACGAAGDLTLAPNNPEGKLYHTLALAALSAHSIIGPGGSSLETVQSLILIAQYDFFSCSKTILESAWKIISFALVIAASIGLHRDPGHWNMDPKYIQHRRAVFWDIFALDKWKSLGTGRPSIFHTQEVDCEFPEDTEAFVDANGTQMESPSRWRHRFAKDIIGPMSEHLCLTRPVKYSEILDWDRKLREFDDPPMPPSFTDSAPLGNVRARMWAMHKEIVGLSIHRNFFARAMIKHPENPLRSPFAPSFLAAYASSIKLLRNLRLCFDQNRGSVLRMWPVWTHCLTSAVIIGSVASNTSQVPLASAAFHDLNLAVTLFEEATIHPVVRRGLPILVRLRERARIALQDLANEAPMPPGVLVPKVEQDESVELAILRGKTRLLHQKKAHCCDVGSPSRWSSSDSHGTPKSNDSSNTSSSSPMLPSEPAAIIDPQQHATADGVLFASPSVGIPISSDLTPMIPGQVEMPARSTSASISQDIAMLLEAIYNSTSSSNAGSMVSPPDFNSFLYRQQSQTSNPQLPHYVFGAPESSQTFGSFAAGSSSASGGSWVAEAAQLGSALSSPSFDAAPTVTTAAPSNDLTWFSVNELGVSPEFTNDTAQFMEDWRFQAAIEGSLLTEPEPDVRMTF